MGGRLIEIRYKQPDHIIFSSANESELNAAISGERQGIELSIQPVPFEELESDTLKTRREHVFQDRGRQ